MAQLVPRLPSEILCHILSFCWLPEIFHARFVSRQFYAISTTYMFGYYHFNMNTKTPEKFRSMLAANHLAQCVRELKIYGPRSPIDASDDKFKIESIVRENLQGLCKLEKVSTLAILFEYDIRHRSRDCRERLIAFRSDLFASVLEPMISAQSAKKGIRQLHITNLQSFCEPSLTHSSVFINLLRHLRYLLLRFQDAEPTFPRNRGVQPDQPLHFYNKLPETWLQPACQNLKILCLSADLRWGWYPKTDFRHVRFPKMKSLALGNFTFSHDWQLEWLLSHESLCRLRLPGCSILAFANPTPQFLDSDGYLIRTTGETHASLGRYRRFEGRWCHYFKAFASALPGLQLFSLESIVNFQWEHEREIAPVAREEEIATFRRMWSYIAYTKGKYLPFFNPDYGNPDDNGAPEVWRWRAFYNPDYTYPDDNEAPENWREGALLQRGEDEKALLDLFDLIEKRNA